jgi:hypothetical protein
LSSIFSSYFMLFPFQQNYWICYPLHVFQGHSSNSKSLQKLFEHADNNAVHLSQMINAVGCSIWIHNITYVSISTQAEHCNGYPWIFFQKIPEIDLRRFSLQFSLRVVVAIHEKFEKFQNIWIGDLSENLQYLEKRFQCDNAVYKNRCRNNEAFSPYASYHWVFSLRRDICNTANGYPWVPMDFPFLNGLPMGDPCNALHTAKSQMTVEKRNIKYKNTL